MGFDTSRAYLALGFYVGDSYSVREYLVGGRRRVVAVSGCRQLIAGLAAA